MQAAATAVHMASISLVGGTMSGIMKTRAPAA